MKAWQKFVIIGLLVGMLNGLVMPIIITFVSVALGIGTKIQIVKIMYELIIVITVAFGLVIGVLFVRYAGYKKGNRDAFKNFAIGFLLPTIVFLGLLWGIIQTAFVYLGCLLGERWVRK
jgi:hypothetical protein